MDKNLLNSMSIYTIQVSSPTQGDGPEKKVTRLAIGVEGGFDPNAAGKKYEIEEFYSVVVLPSFTAFAWPNNRFPEIVSLFMFCMFYVLFMG